jgi:hypothetical protein
MAQRKDRQSQIGWVLPGHGRRYHGDRATMAQQLQTCITWMKAQAS